MARITAYLAFAGNCREAMEFYRDGFGGELKIMTVGESPMAAQFPAAARSKVMHADLGLGELRLMASDDLRALGTPKVPSDLVSLMIECGSEDELRSIFGRLSAGGKVEQEPTLQFWGALYAAFEDRFGLRWMLNWEKPGNY